MEREAQIQSHINHLEKYEKTPEVISALSGLNFRKQIHNFYDSSTYLGQYPVTEGQIKFDRENPDKKEKPPSGLIKILNGFANEPLDKEKLIYGAVREDHERWKKIENKQFWGYNLGVIATTVGFVGGILFSLTTKESLIFALGVGVGTGGGILAYKSAKFKPKGTNHELAEFCRLDKSAIEADNLLKEHYKDYFIKKALSK